MCCLLLIGIVSILVGCDGPEEPFVISNTLHQTIVVQILEQGASDVNNAGSPLKLAPKDQQYEPSVRLTSGETTSIFTEGVFGGRVGYVVIISDENGTELFLRTFSRDELIKHKFKLTITEQGIQYSL